MLFALGCTRIGFVFSLLVTDDFHLGPFLSLQSPGQADLFLLALDSGNSGLLAFLRSLACADSVVLVLDFLHLGLFMLVQCLR